MGFFLNSKIRTQLPFSPINTSSIADSNLIVQPSLRNGFLKNDSGKTIFDFQNRQFANFNVDFKALILPSGLNWGFNEFLENLAKKGVVIFYPETFEGLDLSIAKNLENKNLAYKIPKNLTNAHVNELSVATKRLAHQNRTLDKTVSIVLCTTRCASLENILPQVYAQKHESLELIIVNHGSDPTAFKEKSKTLIKKNSNIETTVITVGKEISFGAAFSKGCSAARGDFVAKIDDDDFYSPYHVTDLLIPSSFENFAIVGKPLHYVHVEPLATTFIKKPVGVTGSSETVSSWVAGGTMLIARDFGEEVGWFSDIASGIDRDIQNKAISSNNSIYKTHGAGYVYSRTNREHTWKTSWQRYMQGSMDQKLGIYGNF